MNRDNRPCRKAGFFIFRPIVTILWIAQLSWNSAAAAATDSAAAAQAQHFSHVLPDYSYFKGYFIDTKNFVCAPAGWHWQQWTAATLALGCGVGLYLYDRDIMTAIQEHRSAALDHVSSIARIFGTGTYIVPLTGIMYLGGFVFKNAKAERTALLGLESMAISGIFTEILKDAFHRRRPSESSTPEIWEGPSFSSAYKSFPSGHATAAAAMATVVALEYRDTPAISAIAYTVAAATGWSRMNDDAHWASDVFAGLLIGYCCSKTIVSSRAGWKLSVVPDAAGPGAGLVLTGTW